MKNDMAKRAERAKIQDVKYREMPDIVVKVVCKYRAELFFKISRKTKLSRLFNAWTERMESNAKKGTGESAVATKPQPLGASLAASSQVNGTANAAPSASSMQFIFSHGGRTLDADQTPEEVGMEDSDEILAVEIMDLTEGPETEDIVGTLMMSSCSILEFCLSAYVRMSLDKNRGGRSYRNVGRAIHKSTSRTTAQVFSRSSSSLRARKTMEEIFDGV